MNQKKNDMLYGIMRVVKTKQNDNDGFMVVIGRTIVSRGIFKTEKEAINDVNKLDTEMACRMLVAAVDAVREYDKQNKQGEK